MSLASCFSLPRPIALCGRTWLARELRLVDYAALESLACEWAGDPLAGLDGLESKVRRQRLRDAWNAYYERGGTVVYGDPKCTEFLTTRAGAVAYLTALLREHKVSLEAAVELVDAITDEEWPNVFKAGAMQDPLATVDALIFAELGIEVPEESPAGKPLSWREVVSEMCESLHCTPAAVGEMTLSEVALVRSGGRGPVLNRSVPDTWTREEHRQKVMIPLENFFNERDEPEGATING